jgi:hypothetical protein
MSETCIRSASRQQTEVFPFQFSPILGLQPGACYRLERDTSFWFSFVIPRMHSSVPTCPYQ